MLLCKGCHKLLQLYLSLPFLENAYLSSGALASRCARVKTCKRALRPWYSQMIFLTVKIWPLALVLQWKPLGLQKHGLYNTVAHSFCQNSYILFKPQVTVQQTSSKLTAKREPRLKCSHLVKLFSSDFHSEVWRSTEVTSFSPFLLFFVLLAGLHFVQVHSPYHSFTLTFAIS